MTPLLRKLPLILALALLVGAFFVFDLERYLSLEYLQAQHQRFSAYFQSHPGWTAAAYFGIYILVTGLSLPGATLLTLAAGAVFGLGWGTLIVSFASTFGATLAFLIARYLARDLVQARFGERLEPLDRGIEREGAFYLFALRLVPLFPFFVINLAMGLTPIGIWTFLWVSQVGMLAGTAVYVNAGTRIAELQSLSGILSPGLIGSFVLLGLFPLLTKHLLEWVRHRRALRAWNRPRRFDRNLVVIGAGSAGLVSAYIAAAVKANVSLIEKDRMGGDCLNTGCVPSKALIRTARFLEQTRRAQELGIREVRVELDFAAVMERVRAVVRQVEPHDSVARYRALGVDCIQGTARILSPWEVEIGARVLTTRGIIVATGAWPFVPPIEGLADQPYLTSDNVWDLESLPRRLLVLGGGPIGCELAQSFARLGSRVTLVEMAPRLLVREDPEISGRVERRFREEGIELRLDHRAEAFGDDDDGPRLRCSHQGRQATLRFDRVLVAVGRRANTAGLGLEQMGVALNPDGTVETDDYLRTAIPTIHACGDVAGPYQFTHAAAHQAWYAAVNTLFGGWRRFKVDYTVIPHATFTDPEVARVGLNESEAESRGIAFEVTRFDLAELDRAIADAATDGLVKVLTSPGRDRILGATIVGAHAGELITEFVAAMRNGYGLNRILGTIHIYPTWSEANKYAAGAWKRAHAPQWALRWAGRYHAWRRG